MNLKEHKKSNTLVVACMKKMPPIEMLNEFMYSVAMQKHSVDLLLLDAGLNEKELEVLDRILEKPTIELTKENPKYKEGSKEPMTIKEKVASIFPLNYKIEKVNLKLFSEIFNLAFQVAVENDYEFFSIAEPEDVYSTYWFDNANVYAQENSETAIFTPIIRNVVHGAFQGYYNEICWAESMAESAGKYDQNLLLKFNCVSPLGALYRVSSFSSADEAIEIREGKLYPMKSNVKLTSSYELFLRLIYHDFQVANIPRLGYEQRFLRQDEYDPTSCKIPKNLTSLPQEKGGFTLEEAQFWHKAATDAYFVEEDEPIEFIPNA